MENEPKIYRQNGFKLIYVEPIETTNVAESIIASIIWGDSELKEKKVIINPNL